MSEPAGKFEELDALLGSLRDGSMDAEGWQRLQRMIREDRAARRRYIETTLLRADLRDRFSGRAAGPDAKDDERPAVVAVIGPSGRRGMQAAAIAAAVVFIATAAMLYGWLIGGAGSDDATAPGAPAGPPVAVLIDAADTRWNIEPIGVGDSVPRQRVLLGAGTATFEMLGGATLTLHGPIDCTIESDRSARLNRGRLSARITPGAPGLTVRTPGVEFVDLGTAFIVDVDDAGRSVLVVTEGHVAAKHEASGRSVTLKAGHAARFDAKLGMIGVMADGSTLLGHELVVNGDFEAGPHAVSVEGNAPDLAVTGWVDHAPGTTLRYEQAKPFGFPDPATAAMPDEPGEAFYVGAAIGEISQTIDVTPLALFIDARALRFDASAWLGGFVGQDDGGDVAITFTDATGATLGERTLDPVTAAERAATIGQQPGGGPRTGFIRRAVGDAVPAGTRSIRVAVRTTIGEGLIDYYVDNVSLKLAAAREGDDETEPHKHNR